MGALDVASTFDTDIDTVGTLESANTPTDWQRANAHADAIVRMQAIMGQSLKGSKADLATRLLVAMDAAGLLKLNDVIQIQSAVDSAVSAALTTNFVFDDSLPQSNEGDEVLTKAFTPKAATSILEIVATIHMSAAAAEHLIAALFVDSDADALAAGIQYVGAADSIKTVTVRYIVVSASTSARTYKIKIGTASQNVVMNGIVTGPARRLGGALISSLRITEWQV